MMGRQRGERPRRAAHNRFSTPATAVAAAGLCLLGACAPSDAEQPQVQIQSGSPLFSQPANTAGAGQDGLIGGATGSADAAGALGSGIAGGTTGDTAGGGAQPAGGAGDATMTGDGSLQTPDDGTGSGVGADSTMSGGEMTSTGDGMSADGASGGSGGASGMDATTPDAGMQPEMADVPEPTKLVVEVTTEAIGGMWGPLNAGAIWVETPSGQWVHTLEYWTGLLNVRHLSRYVEAVDQGAPAPALFGGSTPPDTIARATLKTHETHMLTWNLMDESGAEVPDGMYKLIFEVTEEENNPGEILEFDFEKGPVPMSWSPPDVKGFTSIGISLE